MVMDGLRGLDTVAYVRFASVYRNFREARDFGTIDRRTRAGRAGEAPPKERKQQFRLRRA